MGLFARFVEGGPRDDRHRVFEVALIRRGHEAARRSVVVVPGRALEFVAVAQSRDEVRGRNAFGNAKDAAL